MDAAESTDRPARLDIDHGQAAARLAQRVADQDLSSSGRWGNSRALRAQHRALHNMRTVKISSWLLGIEGMPLADSKLAEDHAHGLAGEFSPVVRSLVNRA